MVCHKFDGRRCLGIGCLVVLLAFLTGGCLGLRRIEGPGLIENRRLGPLRVAVAPALNQSGSADFDPEAFADVMASELTYVEGIEVIPVSRVLGVLSAQGTDRVETAAHALELRQLVGADAILVFAVTEYDPYDPPTIGISAQLYGMTRDAQPLSMNPVAVSRQTSFVVQHGSLSQRSLLSQTQRVFDAGHEDTVRAIKVFAAARDSDDNPFGWRKYVVSQREYMRFCCHEILKQLVKSEDQEQPSGEKAK